MPVRSPVRSFVDQQQEAGRYWFRREELQSEGDPEARKSAVRVALHRLEQERRVQRLWRDFYIIVPLEFRKTGATPATWFIDPLMRTIGRPYYVGLLSAGEVQLRSTNHERVRAIDWSPDWLQIVCDTPLDDIKAEGVEIQFFSDPRVRDAPTENRGGPKGPIPISTVALTAFDLVKHLLYEGNLQPILDILKRLCETIPPEALVALARQRTATDRATFLRLGYLLDLLGRRELSDPLWSSLFSEQHLPFKRSSVRSESLSESIRQVPEDVFWKALEGEHRVPDYNRIFVWYLRQLYEQALPPTEDFLERLERGDILNLSTFQRVVASERKRREPSVRLLPDVEGEIFDDQNRWGILLNVRLEGMGEQQTLFQEER